MTNSIVSMLLEGNIGTTGVATETLTANEAACYTLESGAGLMARQCVQELHDIFEVAVVETNEAALAAHMEGTSDVMESATYGPVFEAAEKSAGKKILEFLAKLRDRVIAFFQNIGAKIMLLVGNYEKFYEKHKDALAKAKTLEMEVTDWNDERIAGLAAFLKKSAEDIKKFAKEFVDCTKDIMDIESEQKKNFTINKFNQTCEDAINEYAKTLGVHRSAGAGDMDTTRINADLKLIFVKPDKVKEKIDAIYIKDVLTKTKQAAKYIKDAQNAFNAAYNDAIKTIKAMTDDMERSEKKGYASYIHKGTGVLSKIQTLTNAYASNGYRALIGRANEAKTLAGYLIAGKAPKAKDDKKDDKNNK